MEILIGIVIGFCIIGWIKHEHEKKNPPKSWIDSEIEREERLERRANAKRSHR
jgi:hypothetical protein